MNGCPQIGGNLWITVGKTLGYSTITKKSSGNGEVNRLFPPIAHSKKLDLFPFSTCAFYSYPHESAVVTTNTYIFKRKPGNNEPVQDLLTVDGARVL